MPPVFRSLSFLIVLLSCASADEVPNDSEPSASLARSTPADALKRLQAMDGQARYRELAAMSFDAYCDCVVRVAASLPSLGDRKQEAAVLLCASAFEKSTWRDDDLERSKRLDVRYSEEQAEILRA